MADMCGDNRNEVIEKAKKAILEATNISSSPEEMKLLDDFLLRCWQMGWLSKYEAGESGIYVEFFAVQSGIRYNAKIVKLLDLMKELNNATMNAFDKINGIDR